MATQDNGSSDLTNDFDIEDLINATDVDDKEVCEVVSSLHKELNSVATNNSTGNTTEPVQVTTSSTSGGGGEENGVKTKGETSNLTLNLSKQSERRPSLSTMSPFATLTSHTPQNISLLTSEDQSAIYKQASLLAIYAMSNKNGAAKAKEMLAVVTKVKNFLTNLVQLAGNSGPQVKAAVHSLVQKLVSGSISEKEFAEKIEQDLKSKHQPDLLPFLQSSVPELRTHLQIQKEYMKQLIDKKIQEKQQGTEHEVTPPTTVTPPITSTSPGQSPGKPSVGGAATGGVLNLSAIGVSPSQQQALKAHLANLPEDQRKAALEKFIYNKQLQLLIQKQKSTLKSINPPTTSTATPTGTTSTVSKLSATQQQLSYLLKQQQLIKQQASLTSPQRNSPRKTGLTGLIGKVKSNEETEQPKTRNVQEDEEEEDTVENIAGVNLKEETAHFLPTTAGSTSTQSCSDETFLSLPLLKARVQSLGSRYGITDIAEDYLTYLSHATEERLKNLVEQVTAVSQHRSEILKDDSHYDVTTDVRGQLKVLERIDEMSATRKQEREKEKILRAAKSRSKQDDPEIAKMKEQAKQIQIAEEREIHHKAANTLALAAIGRRKRTATTAFDTPTTLSAVFSSPSNKQKARKINTKDILITMEQEREKRNSLLIYKTHLN